MTFSIFAKKLYFAKKITYCKQTQNTVSRIFRIGKNFCLPPRYEKYDSARVTRKHYGFSMLKVLDGGD